MEPSTVATELEQVLPGVWRWHIWDDRIGAESHSHAVAGGGGTVLIDPLPLEPEALEQLGPVTAICLTAACHQRAAWRYRKQLGVHVHAPENSPPMDEEPDVRYREGDVLPGGLRPVHTPRPEAAHYAFLRAGPPSVLFCADLLMREDGGPLDFIPFAYHDDPAASGKSVRALLNLEFDVLCLDHGAPVKDEPRAALRALLERDG